MASNFCLLTSRGASMLGHTVHEREEQEFGVCAFGMMPVAFFHLVGVFGVNVPALSSRCTGMVVAPDIHSLPRKPKRHGGVVSVCPRADLCPALFRCVEYSDVGLVHGGNDGDDDLQNINFQCREGRVRLKRRAAFAPRRALEPACFARKDL